MVIVFEREKSSIILENIIIFIFFELSCLKLILHDSVKSTTKEIFIYHLIHSHRHLDLLYFTLPTFLIISLLCEVNTNYGLFLHWNVNIVISSWKNILSILLKMWLVMIAAHDVIIILFLFSNNYSKNEMIQIIIFYRRIFM